MGKFKRYEDENPTNESPPDNSPYKVIKINQDTELNTSDWYKVNLPMAGITGLTVIDVAIEAEVKLNNKSSDPFTVSPGDYFPGEINELWVRNAETYPGSLDSTYLELQPNLQVTSGGQSQTLVKTLREIFKKRYRYASGSNVNALIVELDTGKMGGGQIVEFWGYLNNYDALSAPKITIYSSNTPFEDGDAETGENGVRFLSRWDYETELADSGPYKPINSKGYFNVTTQDAYRFVYLAIDYGEDGGTDLYGDAEIEISASR